MSKPIFLTKILCEKSLTLLITSIMSFVLIASTSSTMLRASENFDRKETIRQTVQSFIQVGDEQYKEGLYDDSQSTLLMAQRYQEYLTDAERTELNTKIEKARNASVEQKNVMDIFWSAKELYNKNKLSDAKELLESIQKNEFLPKVEHAELVNLLKEIEIRMAVNGTSSSLINSADKQASSSKPAQNIEPLQTASAKDNEIVKIYYQSREYDQTGQYAKAKEGYLKMIGSGAIPQAMAQSLEDDIERIDKILAQNSNTNSQQSQNTLSSAGYEAPANRIIQSEMIDIEPAAGAGQQSYLDTITQQRDQIRDYIKTITTETVIKVQKNIGEGKFDLAKLAVRDTQTITNQYKIELGDDLYQQYQVQFNSLNEQINSQEQIQAQSTQASRNEAALQEQAALRLRQETDTKKRVDELMAGAQENMKRERYDAALGQLEKLLAIDPLNQKALILKEVIEDTQYLAMQRDLQKLMDKETADLYIKGDEAKVPYADLVTFPTNWRDISSRTTRQPDKPFGIDESEEAVYRQLEEIVDLSSLDENMTFAEVIERIKNSVTPPLQIQPNWRDLADLPDIQPTTPSEMGPLASVKLKTALEVLLSGLSTPDVPIGYVVREGVIMIATKENLPSNMVRRVYDIADLVGMPSTGYGTHTNAGYSSSSYDNDSNSTSNNYSSYGSSYGGGGYGGYGGGMMGGYGGGGMMGGYGGGGMMGGGYGGGGYGGGGMMGGYGGSSMMGGYGSSMMGGGMNTSGELVNLIEQIIEPESWYDVSEEGEGTVYTYPSQSPKKLAVTNTPEVHAEIEKLLTALRASLTEQVSIEARFLIVTENWLNDVGLDLDFLVNAGGKIGLMEFQQDSYATATPDASTKVSGSLGGVAASMSVAGGYGSILDDLQVAFLVKATQARTDSKSLNAPRVTVLNGETASFNSEETISYMTPPASSTTVTPTGIGTAATSSDYTVDVEEFDLSTPLYVTPTITHDKKHVIINFEFELDDLIRIRSHVVPYIDEDGDLIEYRYDYPETQTTSVVTRVVVPDQGTLLLGGQKLSQEVEKEAGVPILSKIPIINRFFMNRSFIKDQKIVLILVKPTIILQEESEAEALGELESLY